MESNIRRVAVVYSSILQLTRWFDNTPYLTDEDAIRTRTTVVTKVNGVDTCYHLFFVQSVNDTHRLHGLEFEEVILLESYKDYPEIQRYCKTKVRRGL